MKIDLTVDIEPVMRLVQQTLPKAAPYVAATMLNSLAFKVREKTQSDLPRVFDRPTPFTVKGVFSTQAKAQALQAEVFYPDSSDEGGKGRYEHMRPGAFGTPQRRKKKSEYLLEKAGILPPGWVMAPGSYGRKRLDGYGNIPGRIYTQAYQSLDLEASRRSGRAVSLASQARARKMGATSEWFAVPVGAAGNRLALNGGRLPAGIYQRSDGGKKLRQWFIFTKKAGYKKRLDMPQIARKVIDENLEASFHDALRRVTAGFARGRR